MRSIIGCSIISALSARVKATLRLLLAAAPLMADEGVFTDVTAVSGVDFVHVNGISESKRLPETDGSGTAFFDADGDGDLELYFVNSGDLSVGRGSAVNALYDNLGEGSFRPIPGSAGAPGREYGMGVLVGDPDNDGDPDLYCTAWGADHFYRNDGNGRFSDASQEARVGNPEWGSSASYLDVDSDGDLDLFVANYVRFELATHPWCGRRDMDLRFYCDPRQYEPTTDLLYRNDDGRFVDISEQAGITKAGNGLGVVAGDFDGDGDSDLYVANDMTPNFLYQHEGVDAGGQVRFHEAGLLTGTALSADGASQAGMGVDAADWDSDGDLDLFVTNYQLENNTLYRNDGVYFTEISFRAGIGEVSLNYLGFGAGFLDFDQDGWLDLFVANGHVHDNIEQYDPIVTYPQQVQLFQNVQGERYEDVTRRLGAALQRRYVARGSAFGDYDGDGDPDIALNCSGRPAVLLRNDASVGNWLRVRLQGRRINRDGVGAIVELHRGAEIQYRHVMRGRGYQSSNELELHFGLGSSTRADSLVVCWPSGVRQRLVDLTANQRLAVIEPD
ncbi:MAG: CRTAC1 family protein [Candidatus Latescibacterota bacterium]|nr:CRTAC1 family protein [Candidatus Latescibacterota bacterium]